MLDAVLSLDFLLRCKVVGVWAASYIFESWGFVWNMHGLSNREERDLGGQVRLLGHVGCLAEQFNLLEQLGCTPFLNFILLAIERRQDSFQRLACILQLGHVVLNFNDTLFVPLRGRSRCTLHWRG